MNNLHHLADVQSTTIGEGTPSPGDIFFRPARIISSSHPIFNRRVVGEVSR